MDFGLSQHFFFHIFSLTMQDLIKFDGQSLQISLRITDTWNATRIHQPKLHWHHLIWYPMSIPRHGFILSMAIRGCLGTKDKIVSWCMQISPLCSLCNLHNEDLHDLFFSCPFSRTIWQHVCSYCGTSKTPDLEVDELIGKFYGKSSHNTIRKIKWLGQAL